jgi:hypothetical protein
MSRYRIVDTICEKLNTKGRLVKGHFDLTTHELILQTDRKAIALDYEPTWIHNFSDIDSTFNSVQVFNKLFGEKIKKVIAIPSGYFVNDIKFAKNGYKYIFNKNGYIRQDIIDEIHYFFNIPYNFNIKSLNGLSVSDDIDDEHFDVVVLNGEYIP